MNLFLVTVKLPKNPNHNPRSKQTGPCPVNGQPCDDVTGEHHTALFNCAVSSWSVQAVRAHWEQRWHVTRVERVNLKEL